jgi:hypothetical protein
MACIYSALNALHVISKVLGLAPYSSGQAGTALPDISSRSPLQFSALYNYLVFAYMLGWFVFDVTWEAINRYPKLSSRNIIPVVIRSCTFAAASLSTLVLCHRRTLRQFCSKLALVDKVLLREKASASYVTTRVIVIVQMSVVFVSSWLLTMCDMSGRTVDFIAAVRMSGWIIGRAIGTLMIVQYLCFVWILKNRFCELNTQLSAMLTANFEEDSLETFASILDHSSKVSATDVAMFGSRPAKLKGSDPLFLSLSKIRSQFLHHDRHHVRALRQIHEILCDVIHTINSDYGIPLLLIMSYAFVSFVMFSYLAMDPKPTDNIADCDDEPSCGRVIMNFCISCTCIIKVLAIAISCHVTSSKAAYTSTVVQKLLSQRPVSSDLLDELQLFSQQLWNVDSTFTAFGFFALNLSLLCSVAGTATTYIVVLLQLK